MRRVGLLFCAVAAGLAVAAPASATIPDMRRFAPTNLPLTFKLPDTWEKQRAPSGYAFLANSSDGTASVAIVVPPVRIRSAAALETAAATFVAGTYGRADPAARSQMRAVKLPGGLCRQVLVLFRSTRYGLTTTNVALVYFFVHKQRGYVFLYHTTVRPFENWEPIFDVSARSVAFDAAPKA
jgi:hypothetical protein